MLLPLALGGDGGEGRQRLRQPHPLQLVEELGVDRVGSGVAPPLSRPRPPRGEVPVEALDGVVLLALGVLLLLLQPVDDGLDPAGALASAALVSAHRAKGLRKKEAEQSLSVTKSKLTL